MKRFLILLLCGLLLASGTVALATEATTEERIEGILNACVAQNGADSVQDWIDGDLAENAGTRGEWYIIGLSQYGRDYDFTAYRKALEKFVAESEIRSATSRQRVALTFLAIGGGEEYIAAVAENTIGELGIMSYVFGLHLINNGVECPGHTAESVVEAILALQAPGGGWAVRGDVPEVDTTAMAIQALAPYYHTNEAVAHGVEAALSALSACQLPDATFESYGAANPESGAQVMTALCALGIDPREDARFIKNGHTLLDGVLSFALDDGNFAHSDDGKPNSTSTLQVFYNLVALHRFEQGLPAFHIMDAPGEDVSTGLTLPTDYRFWTAAVALALGAVLCIVLLLRGRGNRKNLVFVLSLAVAAAVGAQFVNIQTAGDYYGAAPTVGENAFDTTITIRCDTVAGTRDYLPADGVILDTVTVAVEPGATAMDQLVAAARQYNIHMENEGGISDYVSGMAYLYEYDFGDMSGWIFRVNGITSDVGCGEQELHPGDRVEWLYSLEMGADIP